jgi:hypothetical protein
MLLKATRGVICLTFIICQVASVIEAPRLLTSKKLEKSLKSVDHHEKGEEDILSQTLQHISHSFDPIPPLEPTKVLRKTPTVISYNHSVAESLGGGLQHSFEINPSSTAPTSKYSSSWSWSNYTKPKPRSIWPQCSKLPRCLNFASMNDGDDPTKSKECEKWKELINYPVIVGDMDGSGSRGITWLLRSGGIWMRTTNEWLDWAKDEHRLSNTIMEATRSLDYKVESLPKSVRDRATKQVEGVLREFNNVGRTQIGKWKDRKLKPFEKGLDAKQCPKRAGWKHGPTLFLQPVYNYITKGKFSFVHLIRFVHCFTVHV